MVRARAPSIVLVAVAVAFLAGCTVSSPRPVPSVAGSSSTASPAHTGSSETTTLSCQQELSATVLPPENPDQHVLGVVSDAWHAAPSGHAGPLGQQEYGGYYFLKVYIYVTKSAAPRTIIRVLQPADVLLFYTDGGIWTSGQLSGQAVVKGATRSVSLANCDSDLTGYAGGILVRHPECVTLSIIAHPGQQAEQQRSVNVPMGRPC